MNNKTINHENNNINKNINFMTIDQMEQKIRKSISIMRDYL
nr:hypothetical protein [Lyticum sinuosum]